MLDHETDPVFHNGERTIQTKAGVRDRAEMLGARMIRPHMDEQHRTFFAALPFIVLGGADDQGRYWASVAAGAPGFLSTPDETTLRIATRPDPRDPLTAHLRDGAPLGVLGIETPTRRRNRMNGRVANVTADGFDITVNQSFGNCPQYIQTRAPGPLVANDDPAERVTSLTDDAGRVVDEADTFFIATGAEGGGGASGADASHRGGKAGFVKRLPGDRLIIPDFRGNNFFNTLGNIEATPRAGLLFVDFATGDVLTMTGAAEVTWAPPAGLTFDSAERFISFTMEEAWRIPGGFGRRAAFGEAAPQLARTGAWSSAA